MIFPDHITRNDMAIDESVGESSYQYCLQVHLRNCTLVFPFFLTNCMQWLFYLILVSAAVKTRIAPRAATKITFDSLLFSSITSITCLSLGQFKVDLVSESFNITHLYCFCRQTVWWRSIQRRSLKRSSTFLPALVNIQNQMTKHIYIDKRWYGKL